MTDNKNEISTNNSSVSTSFNLPQESFSDKFNMFESEEFAGVDLELTRVKLPSGGGIVFEIPKFDSEGDFEAVQSISGVIVYHHDYNSYWERSEANGTPPDCSAGNGYIGLGNPGGFCADCPLNQFGSGTGGKGKACKNAKLVYLLREGDIFPLVIKLPATSIKPFNKFLLNCKLRGLLPSQVVTTVTLKKAEANGTTYSVACFSMVPLHGETAENTALYAKDFREKMRGYVTNHDNHVDNIGENVHTDNMAVNIVDDSDMPF